MRRGNATWRENRVLFWTNPRNFSLSTTHSLKIKTPWRSSSLLWTNFFRLFLNNFFYRQARKKHPSGGGDQTWGCEEEPKIPEDSNLRSPFPAILPQFPLFSLLSQICPSLCVRLYPSKSFNFFSFQLKLITTSSCSKFKPAVGGY